MKTIFISLLPVVLFPAAGFPQFISGDTISLRHYSDAVIMGTEIDSAYDYLNNILPANNNSDRPCDADAFPRSHIFPIYPNLPYPNPFSVSNKQQIRIENKGKVFLVLTDHKCDIGYIMNLGVLGKGSEIWHSPSELMDYGDRWTTLQVVLDDTVYDRTEIAYYDEIAEGLDTDWEPDDISPNCTLVKTADTTRINNNKFDFMFELKDEYPYTVLELLDSDGKLIRYFFRMYLDKGIYGVFFNRIDGIHQPLEYGDYKLRLAIADKAYICNLRIVE